MEDQVQLEVINQGNVLITDVKIQALLVFFFFFFSFWQDTMPRQMEVWPLANNSSVLKLSRNIVAWQLK